MFSRITLAILGFIISSPNLEESHVFTLCGEHAFQVLQKHAKKHAEAQITIPLFNISLGYFQVYSLTPQKILVFQYCIHTSQFLSSIFLFHLEPCFAYQLPLLERRHSKMQINLLFNRAKVNFSLTMGQQH